MLEFAFDVFLLQLLAHIKASLAGAFICAYGWEAMGMRNAMVAGMLLVVVIRFLAAYYRWNLPKVAA